MVNISRVKNIIGENVSQSLPFQCVVSIPPDASLVGPIPSTSYLLLLLAT